MIIAIDGPAGSGKTTVAKLLSKRLGVLYLDSGATYRALTLKALQEGVDLRNAEVLRSLAESLVIDFREGGVYLNGEEVTKEIRAPQIDKNISVVVKHPQVREVMVSLQRRLAHGKSFIIEGRDTTTVVFPQAQYKFYLDGDSSIRAARRYKELRDKNMQIGIDEVSCDLDRRDHADKTREVGPLKVASDATYVDTTNLSIEAVVEKIASLVTQHADE